MAMTLSRPPARRDSSPEPRYGINLGVMKRDMLSTMEISMSQPQPSRSRRSSAANAAIAASLPARRSAAGVPTFCGPFSGSPVRSITLE
ncbi:hypothetical protein D3C86_1722500 [compost metagenome]